MMTLRLEKLKYNLKKQQNGNMGLGSKFTQFLV